MSPHPYLNLEDQLTQPLFDPTILLPSWSNSQFDFFSDAEVTSGLSLEEQERMIDLRIDFALFDTLELLYRSIDSWLATASESSLIAAVNPLLNVRPFLGSRNQVTALPHLIQWANANCWTERQEINTASLFVLGWHDCAIRFATELLSWSTSHPNDIRSKPIQLWHDSISVYPEARLKFWALTFPADPRYEQILRWEQDAYQALRSADIHQFPELFQ